MNIQDDFFAHIVGGHAGRDSSLMARIALNLGYDAQSFPVRLDEISMAGQLPRDRSAYMLNELLMGGYLQMVATGHGRRWDAEEAALLIDIAQWTPPAMLYALPRR